MPATTAMQGAYIPQYTHVQTAAVPVEVHKSLLNREYFYKLLCCCEESVMDGFHVKLSSSVKENPTYANWVFSYEGCYNN